MKKYELEICVDSVESAIIAKNGGADRIELCGHLIIGGVTPSIELFKEIRNSVDIPVNVLIRPRFGDFLYTEHEFNIMVNEVRMFQREKADAVVIGCLSPDGALDIERMKRLVECAGDMRKTLHRAFDVCSDPFLTMWQAKELGIDRILTSGQKNSCNDGMELLSELAKEQSGVDIMAGSGVDPEVIGKFIEKTPITSFHMSAKTIVQSEMLFRNDDVSMGMREINEFEIWRTDFETVAAARKILDDAQSKLDRLA
ncbi:MAG: copper homeostasis protein CutC [Oscillospiraceae bacterium]